MSENTSKFDRQLERILGDVNSELDGLEDNEPSVTEMDEILPVVFDDVPSENEPLANKDLDEDYRFSRSNIRGIITRTNAAMELALKFAVMTENPKMLSVVSDLAKVSGDATKTLVDLQKKVNDSKTGGKPEAPAGSTYVQNNTNTYYVNDKKEKDDLNDVLDSLEDSDNGGKGK